ncbi:MAG: DUF6531 domain-containing protein [Fibrobacterota bacterium]|nr:DUF6531 domain-containing protein [Fibrobacterota bacterium]
MPIDIGTGAVLQDVEEIAIPGRFPLKWTRHYHSFLNTETDSPFGLGWASPYSARLTRQGKDYRFVTPSGGVVVFPDPQDTVERSGLLRDIGSNHEITRAGMRLRITHWKPTGKPVRYYFQPDRNGQWWPLRVLENEAGHGIELAWDDQGRLKGLRQKLEKRTLAVAYSSAGRISNVAFRHADGRETALCRYEYDSKGMLAAAFDALGNATRYQYTDQGLLRRELEKDGAVFTYKYDDKGRCIRYGGLDDYNLKVLRYLDHIRWTDVTNSYGDTRRFEWLPGGQIIQEIDPMGGIKKTEYDDLGRVKKSIGPMGETTAFEYDEAGNRSKRTDPLGRVTTWEYNEVHQPVCEIDPKGGRWENKYDDAGRILAAIDPLGFAYTAEYDASENPILYRKPDGVVSRRAYAANGDLIESTDWEGRKTLYARDEFGRILESTDPDGTVQTYRYDLLGRNTGVSDNRGRKESYELDAVGNLLRSSGSASPEVRFRYGTCRRLLEKRVASSAPVKFKWGSEPDRLESVINGRGETYSFGFDAGEHVTRETGFDGQSLSLLYDLSGRCIRKTNPLGQIVAWKFDAAGQLVSETLPDGEQSEFEYDDAGDIIAAKNAWADLAIERDALGRNIRETQNGFGIRREFGPTRLVQRLESDVGTYIGYKYDGNGLVAALDANGLGTFRYDRNAGGLAEKIGLPGDRSLVQSFDSRGRLLRQALTDMGPALSGAAIDRSYAYGESGTLQSVTESEWGKTTYAYDDARRLIGYSLGMERAEYDLDPSGDPVAVREGERILPVGNATGGAISFRGGVRYDYDAAGRLESKTEPAGKGPERKWLFAWDAKDRLRKITTPEGQSWEYAYDPFGRRISKKGPGKDVRFIWNGATLLHELEKEGSVRTWGFEPNRFKPVFRILNGKLHSIITDHLGTPREMVDPDGKAAWSMRFDPWGKPIAGKGDPEDCPWRFQGQYFDAESGLHYNHHRFYDPESGRYISKDPIRLYGGIDQYQYATNPIETLDPLGLCKGGSGPGDQGREGVEQAKKDIIAAGGKILGEETTIDAGGVRTRPDLYVELPGKNGQPGERIFVEVKTGPNAGHTDNQKVAFPVIATTGGVPAGSRAEKAGLEPGKPIGPTRVVTVHYPWPLP